MIKAVLIIAIFLVSCGGGGGSSSSIEANNGATFPANGTKSGNEQCGTDDNEWTLYQDYHDGNGGITTSVVEKKSPICGWKELPI